MTHTDRPFPSRLVSIPTIFDATFSCVNGSHRLFLIVLCIFAFALQEPILLLLLIRNIFFNTWVCYHIYYYQCFLHSFPVFGIKSKVTVASPEKTWILSLALPFSLLCFTWMFLRFHLAPVVRQLLSCLRDLAGLCLLPRTFSLHSTLHLDDAASCFCYHVLW